MRDLLSVFAAAGKDTLGHPGEYAIGLAKATGAHLTALVVEGESLGPTPQVKPDNMQGDIVEVPAKSPGSRLFANTTERLVATAKHRGIECSVLSASSGSPNFREILIGTAQVRDLVVLDVQGPLQRPMLDWVEAVLFGSGRPVVLAPPGARAVFNGTVVFAWDESRSAVRALNDIMPLIIDSREVVVVSATDDKQSHNPESGDWICSYLARWGVTARFQLITRRSRKVGVDLLDVARRMDADILAMGGFAHSREREFIFGSATSDVFQSNLQLPIFLSH